MLQHSFGHHGSDDSCFFDPTDVAVGLDGAIYVTDTDNHRIQCFRSDGTFVRTWGSQGSGDGQLDRPEGVATGIDGRMKEPTLVAMSAIPELNVFPPGLLPICASYVGDEYIVVSDTLNDRMQIYEVDGKFMRNWGSSGGGRGEFHWPTGCDVDANGLVYVADCINHRIQAFDMSGTFIRAWGNAGGGGEQLKYPSNVSVGDDGLLYITHNCCIVCYRSDGTLVHQLPSPPGTGVPRGVTVNAGMVYVSDIWKGCVWQYRLDGTIVRKWDSVGNADVVIRPCGLSKIVSGVLYVADVHNHQIVVMNVAQLT